MLTAAQALDHIEYAIRSAFMICAAFVIGFLIGALVSDREVEA
jgi:uncharacterized membrane protein